MYLHVPVQAAAPGLACVFYMTDRLRFDMPERQVTIPWGKTIMTVKGAGLLLALSLAVSTGAAAAPLSHLDGLSNGGTLAQPVRQGYWKRSSHRGLHYRHGCPYWYELTFWGSWRLYSPCSAKAPTHAY
jgi:hypothetical protein